MATEPNRTESKPNRTVCLTCVQHEAILRETVDDRKWEQGSLEKTTPFPWESLMGARNKPFPWESLMEAANSLHCNDMVYLLYIYMCVWFMAQKSDFR